MCNMAALMLASAAIVAGTLPLGAIKSHGGFICGIVTLQAFCWAGDGQHLGGS